MRKRLLDWLDQRTGYRELVYEALYERIPGGARWRYVWGSTLVFTFTVQVLTGLFLWTAYSASAQTAWESVYFIQDVMAWGWLVRGLHHYTAQAMIVLMALHLIQVIVDGAYRAPREINFWLGIVLMQIVFGLSLTGYLLPWDQKGYYATQVSTNIMGSAPVVGPVMQEIVQGGPRYGHHTLTRFFAMHAGILPTLLVSFLFLHVYMFRRHGITVPNPNRAPETMFWPDQVLRDAVACLGVLAVVLLLVVFRGAELSAPADPSQPYSAARPEWYFLFLFRFLKFQAVEHYGLAFGAIYVPTAVMLVLTLMPITGKWRAGHAFNVVFIWALMAGTVVLTGMAVYEDRQDADYQAALHEADRTAARAVALAQRPEMIPVTGAVSLLRTDPLTQGPKIFAATCKSCHRYNGHDGIGGAVTIQLPAEKGKKPKKIEQPPTAADLGKFGEREWIVGVLTDYRTQFAAFKNASDKKIVKTLLDDGEMAKWSAENKPKLLDPANKESLDALVSFLAAQAARPGSKPDAATVKKGEAIFEKGKLAKGELTQACAECHELKPVGSDKAIGEKGSAPSLTGYAGSAWLKQFINDPKSPTNYGEHNFMPVFKSQLEERDVDLLARWLTGDYYRPEETAAKP